MICPAAKQCPAGSAQPQDCPAGYYVDFDGAANCLICPEGWPVSGSVSPVSLSLSLSLNLSPTVCLWL